MKRLLSTPLSLILAVFLLASSLVSCPDASINPSGKETDGSDATDDVGSEDPTDNEDSSEPSEGVLFNQTSIVGWNGTSSATVTPTVINGTPGWAVINNDWNASPVFSIDLGSSSLGDYAGFSCKVLIDSHNFEWRNLSIEADSGSGLKAIQNSQPLNTLIGGYPLGSSASEGATIEVSIPFLSLEADIASLTGPLQLAIGISAPEGTSYTMYDLELVTRKEGSVFWLDASPLKTAIKKYFDYFGIAVIASDLEDSARMEGLVVHADSVTIGNEFKPDYILGNEPSSTTNFTALDGNVYSVPAALNFTTVDASLELCRANDLEMRGHVLVWHSQSPKWFFREGFSNSGNLVSTTTMNARLEWYIKSVLEHITDWENTHNAGERIITTWDVVNEAASDGASNDNWLRGSNGEDSDWYAIYGNADFIANSFFYANKYAPPDVLLAYNDYNCYIANKTAAIIKIIDAVVAKSGTRIDVLGMQSHVGMNFPGVEMYKTAVNAFTSKGLDVQVTELDIHCTDNSDTGQQALAILYGDYFDMFVEERATESSKGITGITIWGLSDYGTWLTDLHNETSYPLLFDVWFNTKPAFDAVIEAMQ